MPYHDGMYLSPWAWLMMAFMVLFWIAVIGGIVWLIVYLTRRSGKGQVPPASESALDILNQRYARGEISKDEYEQMKKDITAR